ncbi:hypothetical protein F5146DRAFT_1144130 [Armillaria mellea]|nr:hypothetical protein F5146DRAFT_1144130 [Armillaria mellea]
MSYVIHMGGELSKPYASMIGLMTGDNRSPGLWNFYSSDLQFMPHPDDVWIAGRQVRNLEQADDGAIFSSAAGIQAHVGSFGPWACRKALCINMQKTKAMVFGHTPTILPTFKINGYPVQWTNEHKYLGMTFTLSHANVFRTHYSIKVKGAKKIAMATFMLDKYLGDLPPCEGVVLYNSRIDPHLTYAAEVVIDTSSVDLASLEKVQCRYLQRLLHLYSCSMVDILWSETGMWPVAYRRVLFALKYLAKVLQREDGLEHIPVWCLEENMALWLAGKPCWLGDLVYALGKLNVPEDDRSLKALIDIGKVLAMVKSLKGIVKDRVTVATIRSTKLPLLQNVRAYLHSFPIATCPHLKFYLLSALSSRATMSQAYQYHSDML